jgi:N-acetylmuramoyl-L-alanine amidase
MNKIIKTNFKYLKPLIPLNFNKVFFIIIHHTASKTATVEQIHQWHLKSGFNGFGYNEYIRKDGTVYIGRGDHIGAQTKDMNSKSYGICVEGNYDTETEMPKAQFDSLVERIKFNKERFKNDVKVDKHNSFHNTACPGKHFPFDSILDQVNNTQINQLEKSIQALVNRKIILSPDYWKQNAQKNKLIKGEFAEILINNFANYINKNS